MLCVVPVRLRDDLKELLNCQSMEPTLNKQYINICSYIGYNIDWVEHDIWCHTYWFNFSSGDCPLPLDLNGGDNILEVTKLKYSTREVSRVFFKWGKNERIFTCDKNKREHYELFCSFRFTIHWDTYGLYIHPLSKNTKKQRMSMRLL